MQTTTNYGLKKPDGTDNYNVANDNDNMDIIDANMQKVITQASTAPTTPVVEDLWIDDSATPNILKRYDGTEWVMVGSVGPSDATTTTPGLLEASDPASGAHPIAVTTDNAAYKAVNGGTYVTAGTGIATTAGTNTETVALADSGVTAGTYPKVTVDAKGRVTGGSGLASGDVTDALGFTPLSTTGTAADSSELGGQPASNYLRTDSEAPNPQTVANAVTVNNNVFVGQLAGTNSGGAGLDIQTDNSMDVWFGRSSGGLQYQASTRSLFVTNGSIHDSSGQLGSASGTWTPASGSLNVAAGTVINVAAVPSGAKMIYVADSMNSRGCGFFVQTTSGSTGYGLYTSTTTNPPQADIRPYFTIYDGANEVEVFFQITNEYLQVRAYANSYSTPAPISDIHWVVS